MARFRKLPVEIEAIQWNGENERELRDWTAQLFGCVDPQDRGDDSEITAEVMDVLHSTRVGVKTGQWIIRGVKGEFYPCDPEVFRETYEPIAGRGEA